MYSTGIAYLLFFLGGALGLHRFYLGKFGTGILYLVTGGFAGLGCIYDLFTLPRQVREANLEIRYRRALEYGGALNGEADNLKRDFRRDISRITDSSKETIERVILRTAKKNSGIATPAEVALEGNIPLDTAKKHLEKLVSEGFAEMRVSKSGTIVYIFTDFLTSETEQTLEDF